MTDQKKQHEQEELHDQATMPDPQNKSRRTALRNLLVGAGALTAYKVLPSTWTQPIVDQIVLPAHAGTSGITLNDPCSVMVTSGTTGTASVTVRVDGFVTPATANLATTIVATPTGGGGPVTVNTTTAADGTFGALITVTGGPGITLVSVVTTVTGASGSASCSAKVPAVEPTPTTTGFTPPTTSFFLPPVTTSFPIIN